jgi:hypothetical protein
MKLRVVPLISSVFLSLALCFGVGSLSTDWSSSSASSSIQASASPSRVCWKAATIVPLSQRLSSRFGSNAMMRPAFSSPLTTADCVGLDRETATNLLRLLGDDNASSHANMIVASRVCLIIALSTAALSLLLTATMTLKSYYARGWATIPLVAAVVSLVLGILSLSFFSNVHRHGFGASRMDSAYPSFPCQLSGGFTFALLFTVFSALPLVTSIVDLSIPHPRTASPSAAAALKEKASAAWGSSKAAIATAAKTAKTLLPHVPHLEAADQADQGVGEASSTTLGPSSSAKAERRAAKREGRGSEGHAPHEELAARRRSTESLRREREALSQQNQQLLRPPTSTQTPSPSAVQPTLKGALSGSDDVLVKPRAVSAPLTSEPKPVDVDEGFGPSSAGATGTAALPRGPPSA